MSKIFNQTPLLRQFFTGTGGVQFFIKYEFLQPSGSFKSRGIGNMILKNSQRIHNRGKTPFVFSSSGGNAGLAAGTVSKQLGLSCTVVVPTTTKQRIVSRIEGTGAKVIVKGAHWREADEHLRNTIMKRITTESVESIYVHPFDDPEIWEGHATIVDEIIESVTLQKMPLRKVKGIVCSIGGGGLYNGIIQGLEKYDLAHKIPVIGVETRGCHAFNKSLKAGYPVSLKEITSIATSLGTANVSNKTYEYAIKYDSKSVVLKDIDVVATCLNYTKDHSIVVEPACGASIHLAYHPEILEKALMSKLSEEDIIVVVACGGSSSTIHELEAALAELKEIESQPT